MEADINKINSLASNYQGINDRVQKGPVNSNFKNLFTKIYRDLQDVSAQFANDKSETIVIKGKEYSKSSPGTLLLLNNYVSQLENLQSLSMDLLTKKGSFEDQVSKMIG